MNTQTTKLPSIVAAVTARISDFDAWTQAFDAHADLRRQAGILGHHINRSADDPSTVCVFLAASDRARLESFLDDAKARMRASGIGAPSIALLVPQDDGAAKGGTLASALVQHEVENYDRWKAGFDADRETRQRAGIVGYTVSRSATNPNQVAVYLQSESLEKLRAMLGSPELAAKMKKGGVTGVQISYLQEMSARVKYAQS